MGIRQTELPTKRTNNKFTTITITVTRLEAAFFSRWRQLRKQGRCRLLLEFKGDMLEMTPLSEPERIEGRRDTNDGNV
jgi:hypothetical protein